MAYTITSPIPGTIWDIKVNVGQKVTDNEVVLTLEAMKMENEIPADFAGTVSSILVEKGQTVKLGQALVEIE